MKKEQIVKDLERMITSMHEVGETYNENQSLLDSLKELSPSDGAFVYVIAEAEEVLKCFLCQEKYEEPNCECCGLCPGVPV